MKLLWFIYLITQYQPGFEFLRLGQGGRATALGESYVAFAGGIFEMYYNPAGTAILRNPQFGATYAEWLQDIRFGNITFAAPLGFGILGFGLRGLYVSQIELREETNPWDWRGQYYNAQFIDGGINYSRDFRQIKSGGFLHGIYSRIENSHLEGIGLDLGAQFTKERLGIGFSTQNLGPKIFHTSSNLPILIRFGVNLHPFSPLILTSDLIYPYRENLSIRSGIEYTFLKILSVRVGYRSDFYHWSKYAGIASGFGLRIKDFMLDYTFTPYDYLGNTHRVAIIYTFASKKAASEEIKKKEKMMSNFYLQQGITAYQQGKRSEAMNYFDFALIWDPLNNDARLWTDKVKKEDELYRIDSLLRQGKSHYEKRNYPEAIFYFSRVLELSPQNADAQYLKAEAERILNTAAPSGSSAVVAVFNTGLSYFTRGEYSKALKEWEKALSAEPNNQNIINYINKVKAKINEEINAVINRAEALLKNEKYREAQNLIGKMVLNYPDDPRLRQYREKINQAITGLIEKYINEGNIQFTRGDYQKAEELFRLVINLDPKNSVARTYLAKIENQLPKKDTQNADRYYLLGIEAYTKNNFELALEYWEKTMALVPDYPNIKINIERARKKIEEIKNRQ